MKPTNGTRRRDLRKDGVEAWCYRCPKVQSVQIQKSKNGGREKNRRRDAEREAEGQTVGGLGKATTTVVQSKSGKE